MSSLLSKKDMPLGWSMHVAYIKALTDSDFIRRVNENFIWIDEVIAEAKKTLTTDAVELLPKTPSSKKTRRRVNSRTSGGGNAFPKRALRSSNRRSSQNSLDLSADGKLPESKKASFDLDAIDELGENGSAVKGAKVRIAEDDNDRKIAIEYHQPAGNQPFKCLYKELEEVTNNLNERELTACARDSDISKVIAINKPVAREGTRKRKKVADTEKDPTMLDISDKENTSKNETVKDDKLFEEIQAIDNKYKRSKTSIKNTSAKLRTKMCDDQHETELKLEPEDDHVSNDAPAKSSEAKKNEESMEYTESVQEESYTVGKIPEISDKISEITDLFEEKRDEYVEGKNKTGMAVNEKGGLDETQKECGTGVTGNVESADNGEEGTAPVDSGEAEDVLVDKIFEDEDQKESMSDDSLECAQEVALTNVFVQQPISILLSSSSVQNLSPSFPSVLAECKSLLVPVVANQEQTGLELMTAGLSTDKNSKAKKLEAVSTKSDILSNPEDRESVMTAAVLIKVASKTVSCVSHSNVISNENKSPFDNAKIVPSNSISVLGICSSTNEGLLPFSSKSLKNSSSKVPTIVCSTESLGDSQEVVFKASSSSSDSSGDSPIVSTVASSCSYYSGNSVATSLGKSSGNSPTVIPKVALSSGALSEDMSMALCAVALSPIRESPKVTPAACSSFMSWEPVSSVTDKAGTIATAASFSPNRSHPKLLGDQAETKAAILTELSPTDLLKKTPWSASADSVKSTSTAGVSPSRIYLKVHLKNSSVDVDNSEMPTNCKMPQTLDSPVKLDLNFKSASDNALVELCSSPVCPSPVDNVDSPDNHLVDPLAANVPELDPIKITRNESKFFPTIGSPKTPEHELNHQGDCKDTSSPLKRFYSKMKVKLGSLLSSQGQTKSTLSSAPRSPGSLSMASSLSRSFKVVSGSASKQENPAASASPDRFYIAPIEDMEVDDTTVQGLSPNAETNSPYSSSPVCLNTTKTKRLSKGRKSHSRRSSVHTRLSISHRRSSGPQRTRLSKRLMSALKRKMSRTPAVSTPIKENVLVQSDAPLTDGVPFRNTRSKMRVLVAEAAYDTAQDQEACSSKPFHPEDNDDAVSDDDVVCDTPPPVAPAKTKVQLEQVLCGSLQQKMNLDEETIVNQGGVGTPASLVAVCQLTQTPSTVKQKRPLGSRIKMLQDMICQSPAFSSKNKKKKSNSSTTSNANSVTGVNKTKKPGLWSTSQRRVSLKRTNKTQKSKAGSQWIDLNDSTSSTGSVSSASVFKSSGSATKTPIHPASFLNLLSKKPSSSSVVSSGSVKSFITHNTPVKITREEQDEQKRKELEVKKKKLEEAEQRKQEQRLRKAEELKRQREERQMLAQKRREERQQKDLEQKREMMLKLEETSKASSRAAEERLREEREKQKLREKRNAEAEQRRRQEEEARQQTALRLERERELLEEQQRLRRELEDQERQQKLNEQRRQEEERRKQLERERLAEQERLRVGEEQKMKEEQEKQRQKEEREKREKAERDRLDFERQRERERQKEIEIEKQREAERQQRLLLKQAEGEEPNQKDKPFAKLLEKHNQNLKCNSSMISNTVLGIVQSAAKTTATTACTSAARVPGTSVSSVKTTPFTSGAFIAPPPVTKPAIKGFNPASAANKGLTSTSVVAEHDSDSYDMTPAEKIRKPASDENYNIADLHSDDSTDDESKPRKKIPLWAQGTQLKALLIAQFTHPPDVEKIFGPVYALDLNEVFKKKKPRFNKRTSSAVWDEPLMPKPSSLKF